MRKQPIIIQRPRENETPYNYVIIAGSFAIGFIVGAGIVLGLAQAFK